MVAPESGHARRAGRIKGFALTLLALLAVLAVTGFVARDQVEGFLDERSVEKMAVRIEGELFTIRSATAYYASMNGGPEALTVEAFEDEGRGKGQLFDPTFTTLSRPEPPAAALKKGARVRYELVVEDLLAGRAPDRLVVLRGVTEGVCLAFQQRAGRRDDPLNPDPENRYPGEKGCTRAEDDGQLQIYQVLYAR